MTLPPISSDQWGIVVGLVLFGIPAAIVGWLWFGSAMGKWQR